MLGAGACGTGTGCRFFHASAGSNPAGMPPVNGVIGGEGYMPEESTGRVYAFEVNIGFLPIIDGSCRRLIMLCMRP